jgi:hypothetical protein
VLQDGDTTGFCHQRPACRKRATLFAARSTAMRKPATAAPRRWGEFERLQPRRDETGPLADLADDFQHLDAPSTTWATRFLL